MALLEVKDLRVHFKTDDGIVKAVDGVSYSVERGSALGIVGESGSGKSVSSLTVMGLTRFAGNAEITGSITFDGYSRWVKLQISHTPGTNLALAGILLAILGLMGSLFVHPRRTWVRVREEDGRTVVEVAGLDRGPERGLGDEIQAITERLKPAGSNTEEKP